MQNQGGSLVERIKGCVVDSAPVPDPDPQVLCLSMLQHLDTCCFSYLP